MNMRRFNIKPSSDGGLKGKAIFFSVYQPDVVDATQKEIRPQSGGVDFKSHGRGDHIWEYFVDLWDSGQSSSHAWLLCI